MSRPKELRISVAVTLPADEFEAADIVAQSRPIIDQLHEAFPGAAIKHEITRPRGPRISGAPPA